MIQRFTGRVERGGARGLDRTVDSGQSLRRGAIKRDRTSRRRWICSLGQETIDGMSTTTREELDGRFAGFLGLLALVLYALTAARSIFTGDSAELAAAAACFGVPHPPGYPLYTLLTSLWTHIFPEAHRAFAANLASGLHGAAAVAALTAFMRRHGASRVAAAGAATGYFKQMSLPPN